MNRAPAQPGDADTGRPRRGWILSAAAPALLAMVWAGCSPERRYELLSFFFDGVPDPHAPDADWSPVGGGGLAAMGSVHPPFARDDCLSCHVDPSRMTLTRDSGAICLTCHEGIEDQFAFMHGPVVALGCMWCHDPHFARNAFLLREPTPALCMQCHSAGQLSIRREDGSLLRPQHADLSRRCIDCHHGHGGSAPGLLRSAPTPGSPEPGGDDASP